MIDFSVLFFFGSKARLSGPVFRVHIPYNAREDDFIAVFIPDAA